MEEIEKAISEIESGHVSDGLRLLERAEKKADDKYKFQIAELYGQWGHIQKAKKITEELLSRYPGEGDLVFFLAELLIDSGDEEQAIHILSNVESDDENGPRALLLLADIYSAQGLDEVAEQKLLAAKRSVPDEPIVTLALAELYFTLGDYQKSIPHYEQLLKAKYEVPGENISLRLAEALSTTGHFEESLPYYEEGLADSPEPESLFSFGFTAYQAGEYGQAVKALNELKQMDPDYGKLYLYLTKSYRAERALDEAFQTAEEGLEIDSFNDELAYEAGAAALEDGQFQTAENYLKKALAVNPLHHDSLKSLAGLFLRQERYEDVIKLLGNIEDSEEQDPVFFWFLASAKREEEHYRDASSYYEQAHRAFADDPAFLEEYGDFLLEEGKSSEAVALFKTALSADPSLIHLEEKIIHFDQ